MTLAPVPPRELMEGSEALARAAIASECRFFAGYPMTPFTELLEHFARLLPDAGGVCINAESELEAVGMAWGALATGARAATGSTGQGLSLMQESFSELTLAELPLVVFNMARGQQDYYQATRGGGHGDYLLAHTQQALTIEPAAFPDLPAKDWAVDGSASGSGRSKSVTPLGVAKHGQDAFGQEGKFQYIATKMPLMEREVRVETGYLDDADSVVVAFGSPAKFVKYAIKHLRAEGHRIGYVRPITLWPFPYETIADACAHVRRVGSFELSAGQMIDDVRIGAAGRAPVSFIGGVSTDHSGFGMGRLLEVEAIRERILALHLDEPMPVVPGYERYSYALQSHQES